MNYLFDIRGILVSKLLFVKKIKCKLLFCVKWYIIMKRKECGLDMLENVFCKALGS